jgi:hypothetical protein
MELNMLSLNAYGDAGRYGKMKFVVGDNASSGSGQITAMTLLPGGNVGIGTTSPGKLLHVETPVNTSENLVRIASSMNNGSRSISGIEFVTNPQFYNADNAQRTPGCIKSGFYSDGVTGLIANWPDSYITLQTTITGDLVDTLTCRGGNVGIGTTSPGGKLEIGHYGSQIGDLIALRMTNHATNLHASVLTEYNLVVSDINSGTGLGNGKFSIAHRPNKSNSLSHRLVIDNSGNVGIGTTSPEGKLEISGDFDHTIQRPFSDQDHYLVLEKTGNKVFGTGPGISFVGSYHTTQPYQTMYAAIKGVSDLTSGNGEEGRLEFYTSSTAGASADNLGMVINHEGNVGIGTDSPAGTLHVQTDSRVHITAGTDVPAFTGMHTTSAATGRAQLVLSSAYSDFVIASSRVNDAHGSTISFAAVNPSNTAEYRKFVINQGNWGSRKDFLDFGLSASAADTNPHTSINSTDTVLTLDGNNKRVGIGTPDPAALLDILGPEDEGQQKLQLRDATTNLTFRVGLKAGTSGYQNGWTTIDPNGGGGLGIYDVVYILGTLSVSSTKNFLIDHPLQPTTKKLIHTAVESPRVDLIYRGTTQLKDGRAIVNIDRQCVGDESCAMEDGTFEALCRDPVYYLQNTTDFNRLIGTIDKNLLTIISEDVNSIAIVNWMVVAERKDRDIVEATQTNDNGRLNTEIIDTSERVNRDGSARYSSA